MKCKNILVIEDDPSIREALKITLEVEGYEVTLASNGKEGLELVKKMPRPCLILLDLMMPIMNGFEFLNFREKDVFIAPIPVVIVSAFSDQKNKMENTQGFIKKPVRLDHLLDLVQQYCG